jgi:tetratricopeptide (TPR) repeat protein
LVLNGGSSLTELSVIVSGLASFTSQQAVNETATALINRARRALLSREVEILDSTLRAILALPLTPSVHDVARYYHAYALHRSGDSAQTQVLLTKLIESAHPDYRARILQGLGSCYLAARDLDESSRTYVEAARTATGTDPFAKCQSLRGIALVRSYRGDHEGSVADLERLFPVMRSFAMSFPSDYCDYLNNLAYELGQVGRIDEAKAAINVALRSPYADRFPDWAETAQELETMQRRVFLPLVFAVGGTAAALGVPASESTPAPAIDTRAIAENAPITRTHRDEVEPEVSAPAQPESQPDIQISWARRIAPKPKGNQKSAILVILAWLGCRRLHRAKPCRQSPIPTLESRGCAKSPPARAPPFNYSLFV